MAEQDADEDEDADNEQEEEDGPQEEAEDADEGSDGDESDDEVSRLSNWRSHRNVLYQSKAACVVSVFGAEFATVDMAQVRSETCMWLIVLCWLFEQSEEDGDDEEEEDEDNYGDTAESREVDELIRRYSQYNTASTQQSATRAESKTSSPGGTAHYSSSAGRSPQQQASAEARSKAYAGAYDYKMQDAQDEQSEEEEEDDEDEDEVRRRLSMCGLVQHFHLSPLSTWLDFI